MKLGQTLIALTVLLWSRPRYRVNISATRSMLNQCSSVKSEITATRRGAAPCEGKPLWRSPTVESGVN